MAWTLDGRDIGVSDWSRTPLSLTLRIRAQATDDYVRGLAPDAGGARAVTFSDGSQETVTGRDARVLSVAPPDRLVPMLEGADYALQSYNEAPVGGGSLYFDVTLTLQRLATRDPTGGYSEVYGDTYGGRYGSSEWIHESPEGYAEDEYGDDYGDATDDLWFLRFAYGDIVLPEGDVRGGEQRARTTSFRLTLPPRRGEAILESLGTIASVQQVAVPDADDYYTDNHPADRNTVRIDPPVGATDEYLTAGEYVVTSWRVERDTASRLWRASMTVSKVADTTRVAGQYGGSRWGHANYGDAR